MNSKIIFSKIIFNNKIINNKNNLLSKIYLSIKYMINNNIKLT